MALGNPERDYVYGTKQAAKIALTQLNRKLTQSEALLGGYVIGKMGDRWRIDWRDARLLMRAAQSLFRVRSGYADTGCGKPARSHR